MLTSASFAQLLQRLRDDYDLIIVDTPPVLAVTDPAVVAPRADAVLLVVRLTRGQNVHEAPLPAAVRDFLDAFHRGAHPDLEGV